MQRLEVPQPADPVLTHEMMYSDPSYMVRDLANVKVRGVLFNISEQTPTDEPLPRFAAHYVRGAYYYQHIADLGNAYAQQQGYGPISENDAHLFGSVEIDGFNRVPIVTTTEVPAQKGVTERLLQISLWLGSHDDPAYEDMDRLVAVRNSLVHTAAVALQQTLQVDLRMNMACRVDVAESVTHREQQVVRASNYDDLRQELEQLPAPQPTFPVNPQIIRAAAIAAQLGTR